MYYVNARFTRRQLSTRGANGRHACDKLKQLRRVWTLVPSMYESSWKKVPIDAVSTARGAGAEARTTTTSIVPGSEQKRETLFWQDTDTEGARLLLRGTIIYLARKLHQSDPFFQLDSSMPGRRFHALRGFLWTSCCHRQVVASFLFSPLMLAFV